MSRDDELNFRVCQLNDIYRIILDICGGEENYKQNKELCETFEKLDDILFRL